MAKKPKIDPKLLDNETQEVVGTGHFEIFMINSLGVATTTIKYLATVFSWNKKDTGKLN